MDQERPNILMIVTDQQRWDCLGCVGRYPIATPHLDRLSRQGVRFTHAFTAIPVCVPARQAMLSGLAPDGCASLWNPDFLACPSLEPSDRFFMAGLSRAGYSSTLIGPWNISPDHEPSDFGFDRHVDGSEAMKASAEKYRHLSWPHGWFGDPSPIPLHESRTHVTAKTACQEIKRAAGQPNPWLIRVDFQDPHLPCRPCEPFASHFCAEKMIPWDSFFDELVNKPYIQRQQKMNWNLEGLTWADWSRTVALYFAMIAQIDDAVGLMLDQLAALNLLQKTLVIYTSDHGDLCGGHGLIDKHYVLYDDVTRVPMILTWPSHIEGGREMNDFVSHLDLGATLADLCGLEGVDQGHGQSMVPLPKGERQPGRDFAVCSANGQQFGLYTQRCIRTHDWLYVWNLTDRDELYDQSSDPGQCVNKIGDPDCKKILIDLRRSLYQVLVARNDPFVRSDWVRDQLLSGRKLDC